MATAAKPKTTRVFNGLRCPHCGDVDTLVVKLETLVIECGSCGEEVTHAEVDAMITKWIKLFNWLASASGPAE
jgi:uncharacterized protein (DUF983 family)